MGFFEWVALYVLCFFGCASLVECCRRLAIKEVHIYYHTVKEDEEGKSKEEPISSSVASNSPVWTRIDT